MSQEKDTNNTEQNLNLEGNSSNVPLGPPGPPGPPGKFQPKKRRWETVQVKNMTQTTSIKDTANSISSAFKSFSDKKYENRKKHVGLSNQGATCYLNSLIQTLMMTPEFRQKLYQWNYEPQIHGEDELKCIPLQLQILFASLQCGERNYYETKDLTSSFGWSSRDSFIQQDVQELCRVLFDALDKTLSNGGKGTPISDMYRGNYTDYIKTAPTHKGEYFERSHKADFLDLQLSISDSKSIEESLHKYQEPETLDGENQWRCEELGNIKVDAIKGFKFNEFPYILTLQLERFGYHPIHFYRIKYSHSVSFPFKIDMNEFLETKSIEPIYYELYSVLIHSGGAESGHYYAYIKDFEENKWYNFNDSTVEEIDEEKVKEMFGGNEDKIEKYGKTRVTSTNAYMLMYRKIDSKNIKHFKPEFNEKILNIINKDNEEFKKEKEQWLKIKSEISLRFYHKGLPPQLIQLKKSSTIKETTKIVNDHFSKLLKDDWKYSENDIRIRDFEIFEKRAGKSYIGKEDLTLEDLKFVSFKSLCIETKEPGSEWNKNEKEKYSIYLIPLNPNTLEFDSIKSFQINIDSTLSDAKYQISESFKDSFDFDYLILVKDTLTETSILIGEDLLMENDLGIKQSTSIFIEFCKNENESKIMEQIEKTKNLIEIYFNKIGKDDYTEKVSLDKRYSTLFDLKNEISKQIKIPMDSFILSTKNFKVPYRELKRNITDSGLFDGIQVYIFEGKSLSDNEVSIKLYLYDPNRTTTTTTTTIEEKEVTALTKLIQKQQQFIFLGQISVDETQNLKQWKEELSKNEMINVSPEKLRIRIKNGPSPGPPIIIHDKPLKDIIPGIDNGKHLVVQILENEENLNENDIIIKIQKWSPSNWKLGKLNEIVINKEECSTTKFLKEKISKIENINLDNVSITKPPMAFEFWQIQECAEVPLFDWENESNNIFGHPYLLYNGVLILFKDNSEEEKIPIEELEKMGHEKSENKSMEKESALKIWTIYDQKE
eukprot:gene5080-8680_t